MLIDLDAVFSGDGGYVRLPADVIAHVRQIFADGKARGNHADVFAKVGDSITVSILSLNPIGDGLYDLGEYGYLQGVIDFYAKAETRDGANSFTEASLAARIGWTTYGVLDPAESDPSVCLSVAAARDAARHPCRRSPDHVRHQRRGHHRGRQLSGQPASHRPAHRRSMGSSASSAPSRRVTASARAWTSSTRS
ncbi:MAG: hypothetical protein U0703_16855 [Anaerolineae bacterium]